MLDPRGWGPPVYSINRCLHPCTFYSPNQRPFLLFLSFSQSINSSRPTPFSYGFEKLCITIWNSPNHHISDFREEWFLEWFVLQSCRVTAKWPVHPVNHVNSQCLRLKLQLIKSQNQTRQTKNKIFPSSILWMQNLPELLDLAILMRGLWKEAEACV